MLRPNLPTQRSVPLVSSRELLGSLTLVRVLANENSEDAATSVDIQILHACTARCFTTAYRVDRFVVLVPHRFGHLVAPRAQLGGLVLVHRPELYTAYSSTVPCPNLNPLLNFPPHSFHRARESTPGHEKSVAIRDNHGPLVILELVMYNSIADVPENPLSKAVLPESYRPNVVASCYSNPPPHRVHRSLLTYLRKSRSSPSSA